MTIYQDYDLSKVTTFHLPARAAYFIEYDSIDELRNILASEPCHSHKIMHIGSGSNLLFTDDYNGVVLHSCIVGINIVNETDSLIYLRVGAGVDWDEFVAWCVSHNYYGAENLSLIPGEVGASAVQNVGAYGIEAKDIIHSVSTIDTTTGAEREFYADECNYGYRDSIFKHPDIVGRYIVTAVTFRLSKEPHFCLRYGPLKALAERNDLTLSTIRNSIIEIRQAKLPDPREIGSAGSFFKNPVIDADKFRTLLLKYPSMPYYETDNQYKIPAGWLIENAGLKGFKIGDAQVYPKQCLVIVNNGNATPSDVVALYRHIIQEVKNLYDINLSPEVNVI